MLRSVRLAIGATTIAALSYALFILNPSNRGDLVPYIALFVAEAMLLAHAVGTWWTVLAHDSDIERPEVHQRRAELVAGRGMPSVDALITVYGEPLDVVENTVRAVRDMRLPHRTWVCDDGRSEEIRELASRLGVCYLRRTDRNGAKAGNINRALDQTNGEFVAIFDADHAPHPDFLVATLPHFSRPDVGFVQSPQSYRNFDGNYVASASAESQRMFYEIICPGRNKFNAVLHVGTNAVFRRTAVAEVGGYDEDAYSEDIFLSLRLLEHEWSGVYLPAVLAQGLAPDTVDAHFRQQKRWASGAFELLLRDNPLRNHRLTLDQRLQYFFVPLFYLLAFATVWFLTLPALFLLFGITPLEVEGSAWLTRYLPFFVLTQLVLWLQSGGFRPRTAVMALATAPVQVRAFFSVLLRRKQTWQATNARVEQPSVLQLVLPQVALLVWNLMGVAVGLATLQNVTETGIPIALCAMHVYILGRVVVQAMADARADETSRLEPAGNLPAPPPPPAPARVPAGMAS